MRNSFAFAVVLSVFLASLRTCRSACTDGFWDESSIVQGLGKSDVIRTHDVWRSSGYNWYTWNVRGNM